MARARSALPWVPRLRAVTIPAAKLSIEAMTRALIVPPTAASRIPGRGAQGRSRRATGVDRWCGELLGDVSKCGASQHS